MCWCYLIKMLLFLSIYYKVGQNPNKSMLLFVFESSKSFFRIFLKLFATNSCEGDFFQRRKKSTITIDRQVVYNLCQGNKKQALFCSFICAYGASFDRVLIKQGELFYVMPLFVFVLILKLDTVIMSVQGVLAKDGKTRSILS